MAIGSVEVNVVPVVNAAAFQAAIQKAISGISVKANVTVNTGTAVANVNNLTAATSNANKAMKSFQDVAADALQAIGGAAAAKKTRDFFASIVTSAGNLNETMNLVGVQFKDSTDSVIAFAETATKQFGLSKREALDFAGQFSILGNTIGKSGEELVRFSTELAGLAADAGSFFNARTEDVKVAFISALRGEYEPIRKYGVLLDETTLNQAAFSAGITKTGKDFTAAQKVQTRYNELLRQTKNAVGDFSRTLGTSLPNQLRALRAEFDNFTSALGKAFLPFAISAVKAARSLVEAFASIPAPIQTALFVVAGLTTGILGLGVSILATRKLMKPLIDDIKNLAIISAISNGVKAASAQIVAAFASQATAAAGVGAAAQAARPAIAGLFSTIAASLPAALVSALPAIAIAAAAAAAAFAIWKLDPEFRAAIKDIFESLGRIPGVLAAAIERAREFVSTLREIAKEVPGVSLLEKGVGRIADAFGATAKGIIDTPFQAVAAGLDFATGKSSEGLDNLKKAGQGAINALTLGLPQLTGFGKNIFGISKEVGSLTKYLADLEKQARAGSAVALESLKLQLLALDVTGKSNTKTAIDLNQAIFEIETAAKKATPEVDVLSETLKKLADSRAGVVEAKDALRDLSKALIDVTTAQQSAISAEVDSIFGPREDALKKRKQAADDVTSTLSVARANEDASDRIKKAEIGLDKSRSKTSDALLAQAKAEKEARKAATTDLEDLEIAAKAADRAVEDGALAVTAAIENERLALQALGDAQRKLDELRDEVPRKAEALARAETGITDALRAQMRATRDRVLAENAYSDAIESRRRAVEDVKKADFALADAFVNQRRALEDQAFAVKDARQVLDGYAASSRDAAKALLDLRDAQLAAEGGAISIGEARDRFLAASEAVRRGTGTNREAQQARLALDQASAAARRAGLESESLSATGAAVPGSKEAVAAQRTIEDSAKVARDAAATVDQARRGQADALKSVRDTTLAVISAQDGLVDADIRIRDSGRAVKDAYDTRASVAKAVLDLDRDIARQQTDVIPAAAVAHKAALRDVETAYLNEEKAVRDAEKAHQAVIDQVDVIKEKEAEVVKAKGAVTDAISDEKDAVKELKRAREDQAQTAVDGQITLDGISLRQQKNLELENKGYDEQRGRLASLATALQVYKEAREDINRLTGVAELVTSPDFLAASPEVREQLRKDLESGQTPAEVVIRQRIADAEAAQEKAKAAIAELNNLPQRQLTPNERAQAVGLSIIRKKSLEETLQGDEFFKPIDTSKISERASLRDAVEKSKAEILGLERALSEVTRSAGSGIGKAVAEGAGDELRKELERVLGSASDPVKVKLAFNITDQAGVDLNPTTFQQAVRALFAGAASGAAAPRFDGGAVKAGRPYVVGESRRGGKGELFVPPTSGTIVSNAKIMAAMMKVGRVPMMAPTNDLPARLIGTRGKPELFIAGAPNNNNISEERLVSALRKALDGVANTSTTNVSIATKATQRESWMAEVGGLLGGRV